MNLYEELLPYWLERARIKREKGYKTGWLFPYPYTPATCLLYERENRDWMGAVGRICTPDTLGEPAENGGCLVAGVMLFLPEEN